MIQTFLVAVGIFLGAALAPEACRADAAETRIYVAQKGNDKWSGSLRVPNADASDGPVATLARAQALARASKQATVSSAPSGPVRVLIGPGTY